MKKPMYAVIEEYEKLQPNGHWFDKDTLRFFKSRFFGYGYSKNNDIFFISSEKCLDNSRLYTIRRLNRNKGNISNVGEFQAYTTLTIARKRLASILGWKIKDI